MPQGPDWSTSCSTQPFSWTYLNHEASRIGLPGAVEETTSEVLYKNLQIAMQDFCKLPATIYPFLLGLMINYVHTSWQRTTSKIRLRSLGTQS